MELNMKNIGLPYWTQVDFVILLYIGMKLEKYSGPLTGFGLIWWYIGLEPEKHLD